MGQPWLRNTWPLYQVAFPPRHHEFSHFVEKTMAVAGHLEPGCYHLTSIWRIEPKFFMVYSSISTKKNSHAGFNKNFLRWSHNITIISCPSSLMKSGWSSLVKKFCDAAITRHAAHSKHRDMAEGCGIYGMVGKTLGCWWLGKPTKKRSQVKWDRLMSGSRRGWRCLRKA